MPLIDKKYDIGILNESISSLYSTDLYFFFFFLFLLFFLEVDGKQVSLSNMNVTATEENVGLSRYFTYSQMTSNEMNIVNIDHCYSKPWSSHPDASNARPLHMLFMEKFPHLSTQEKQR